MSSNRTVHERSHNFKMGDWYTGFFVYKKDSASHCVSNHNCLKITVEYFIFVGYKFCGTKNTNSWKSITQNNGQPPSQLTHNLCFLQVDDIIL